MNEFLKQILALKPSEIATTLASLVDQVSAIVDRLDGDSEDMSSVQKLLESTKAYAEAVKMVTGSYSLDELAKSQPLFAGGSGKERLEAGLLAEAVGTPAGVLPDPDYYPAPAPTPSKPVNHPPPPVRGDDDE